MTQPKDQSIETLRGIAIILVVAGHVIGSNESIGMQAGNDSFYRHAYDAFQYLRMPLFTAISGFVYAMRPVASGSISSFIQGKTRRILLPFISVATLYFIIKVFMPGVNNPEQFGNIWRIYLFPFLHLWFLQAIFIIFITVTALEYLRLLTTTGRWLACLTAAGLSLVFVPRFTEILAFQGYLILLPFFILGVGLNRFGDFIFRRSVLIPILFFLIIGVIIQQSAFFHNYRFSSGQSRLLGLLIGLTGTVLLFHIRRAVRPLARLGFFSYAVYLFHGFGCAGNDIIIGMFGIGNSEIIFFSGLAFGLFFPVVVEMIIIRNTVMLLVFLGLK